MIIAPAVQGRGMHRRYQYRKAVQPIGKCSNGYGAHERLATNPDAHQSAVVLAAVKMLWGGSGETYPSLH